MKAANRLSIPLSVAAALILPAILPGAQPEPIEIGSTPQFFLDDHIVDNRWSLKPKREEVLRVFHAPERHAGNPLISSGAGYCNVVRDAETGLFRMWYQTHTFGDDDKSDYAVAYAESRDGLKWELPKFDFFEWKGARQNNIVWRGKGEKRASGCHIVEAAEKDRRGYRYLMLYHVGGIRDASGLRLVGSRDGIHWDEEGDTLLAPIHSDTQNNIVYDSARDEYVMFLRPKDRYLAGQEQFLDSGESRRVSRLGSRELWALFPGQPQSILIPDELDMQRGFNRFYGMSTRYHAGIYWGFAWPFKLNTDIVTELAWSHDGWDWQRFPTRPRVLELGPEGAWDDGMVFCQPWIEVGDEWWFYYTGHDGPHESRERVGGIGLATLRKEGFISMRGPPGGGVICTRLIRWPGGDLALNAKAAKGEMRVRISDALRKIQAGFDFPDMETFSGDSTAHIVKWRDHSLDELKGREVRIEFFLRDADLYTFRAAAVTE